ncbi:stimulated by retinoic acid gene 8 protein homolog [Ambystoma mexicanum]|uniref:stimulated by retinoic acid gene 8 protein homolog n=1 Tax=Ambystoma mexicanum TaxID=8296 RepID=UPI0037E79A52
MGLSANLQVQEPSVARRRMSQARQRATLAGLIGQLRESVYPEMELNDPMTKGQVLRRAKNYIQELEQTLDTLLRMKESFHLEDGNPCSLEKVKEEYVRTYCCNASNASCTETSRENPSVSRCRIREYEKSSVEEEGNRERTQPPVNSSPDLMEFERYLYFYKQTVDLLVENQIVSAGEVTLPVVSSAISHLWQGLPEDQKANILQYCIRQEKIPTPKLPYTEPVCTDSCVRGSQADSQEASGSLLSSPPEEVLFEDAFDLATGFLDHSEIQGMSSPSSMFDGGTLENPEQNSRLYREIVGFLRCHLQAIPQDSGLQFDYETVMLRCTETFDDEDL